MSARYTASTSSGSQFFVAQGAYTTAYDLNDVTIMSNIPIGTVVRDMGKTVRTPAAAPVTGVTTQVVLRKVCAVTGSNPTGLTAGQATSFVGFSEGGQTAATSYYINLLSGDWMSINA